jgi:hypothetical protein
MRSIELTFGVLVVLGLALAGYGFVQPSHEVGICVDGDVDADRLEGSDPLAYDGLSTEAKALFDRARADGGCVEYWPPEKWSEDRALVRHEGQVYDVSVYASEMNAGQLLPLVGGWVLFGLGAAGLGVTLVVRWWRGGGLPFRSG